MMATPPCPEPRPPGPPTHSPDADPTRAGCADSAVPPSAGDHALVHPSEAQTLLLLPRHPDQAGPPPASATAPTPEVIDALVSYRLGREIGRGGMGSVLEGRDTRLGRE